jgi:hypothetical protein
VISLFAVSAAVACNAVLGNHLDHAGGDAGAAAALPEAGAPFCKNHVPGPHELLCDDFDEDARTQFTIAGKWESSTATGGQTSFDKKIFQSPPASFLSVYNDLTTVKCEYAILTKDFGGSFHKTHAAYSLYVAADNLLPGDTVSVQQLAIPADGGDRTRCGSVVLSSPIVTSAWEQISVPGSPSTIKHHDSPPTFTRKVGAWQRYDIVTDIQARTLTLSVDGVTIVSASIDNGCPFALGAATFELGIYCPNGGVPGDLPNAHQVNYDDVIFEAE